MAIKVDGTEVTKEVAGWPGNQTLAPLDAAQGGQKYVLAADTKTASGPKTLTNSNPPGYTVTGMPDNTQGFGGKGASGPLGGAVTNTAGDALGIADNGGGASADASVSAGATTTVNGAGSSMTVKLTVKQNVGVTAAEVVATGSGYVMNERVKVAKSVSKTTNDVFLYILG